ncbi:MAG: O-antigen ligase family protein [Proteobacteria bacterium]|nr:O-antigen ligase family protein [Pseudomonadota bacterium]MBI3497935.1 O-antigen ligase family protein [Pseudomonadota bacterium]
MTAAQSIGARTRSPATHAYPMGEAASTSELGVGGMLIVGYLAITRIGHLSAAKIGIMIGPVPLFLTELFLIALVLTVAITRTGSLVVWLVTGGLARMPGLLLWLLFLTSILYTLIAFGDWGILAVRDLAIFSYGIVFALTYFVLDSRAKAAAAMRWFTYSGVVLAVALIIDTQSGAQVLFDTATRVVTDSKLLALSFGSGDVGGIIGFSLMALLAYAASNTERRLLHLGAAAVAFFGLALTQTRSAVLGMALSSLFSLLGMRTTQRLAFVALAAGGGLLLVATPILLPESGLAHAISSFFAAVEGGMSLAKDDNFYFRLLRWDAVFELWRDNPLFGVGFGQPLVPAALINEVEEGSFNVGLPHNTYLTILARLGLFGFVLIIGAWLGSIALATRAIHRPSFGGDAFAAASALVSMIGFATFTLFLERPMHAATLWIVAAIACRLNGPDDDGQEPQRSQARGQLFQARAGAALPLAESGMERARRIAHAKGFR